MAPLDPSAILDANSEPQIPEELSDIDRAGLGEIGGPRGAGVARVVDYAYGVKSNKKRMGGRR